ncbi:hypothetical protein [Paeniglutamicibacter antarcticus]
MGAEAISSLRGKPGDRALRRLVVDDGKSMVLGQEPVFIDSTPSG